MILTGTDAVEALMHLLPGGPRERWAVWHKGKRYGGFTSKEHAQAVARLMGWKRCKFEVNNA